MRHLRIKKTMEHADAPSGYVTLYRYKEPFMKFTEGYGYRGVLLFDGKTDKVQCHLCGDWFEILYNHLHREHSMTASQYKEKVGLLKSTALISESFRERLIASGLNARMQNFKKKKLKMSEESKKKISQTLKENYAKMESRNITGTCPEQLLDRLRQLALKLGRTPSVNDCTFHQSVERTYGSYLNGIKKAGLEPAKTGVRHTPSSVITRKTLATRALRGDKYGLTREKLLAVLKEFNRVHGRAPSYSDFKRRIVPEVKSQKPFYRVFGTYRKAVAEANLVTFGK